jgi:hypothetical protein
MCDEDEEKLRKGLARRSLIVGILVGASLGVMGLFAASAELIRRKIGATPTKGGPYAMPSSDERYTFVDISQLWNDVGITKSAYRSLSNFDQNGKAIAQEACPPSFGPNLAVVSCPNDGVSFVFPDETDRVMNVIKCQSQRADVPEGRYSKIHLLGASIKGTGSGTTGFLQYAGERPSEFELQFEPWRSFQKEADVFLDARKIYLADGTDLSGSDVHAYLYHVQVECDQAKVLEKLVLPSGCHCRDHGGCACKISDIRVLAITLER